MKLGSDGGINAPYIINPLELKECRCCGRLEDLRIGVCFHCAEIESVIGLGCDMYDKPIPQLEGYSDAMSKAKYIIEKVQKMFKEQS